jgi:hypothetical protein
MFNKIEKLSFKKQRSQAPPNASTSLSMTAGKRAWERGATHKKVERENAGNRNGGFKKEWDVSL